MTSMEIRSLLEEAEPSELEEGDGAKRRPRRLLILTVAIAVFVVGLVGYFVLANHASSVSSQTVTSGAQSRSGGPTPAQATTPAPGVSSTAGVPVPSTEYFSVKNPFAPRISQSGSASSAAGANG